jgi:hypothetical protein
MTAPTEVTEEKVQQELMVTVTGHPAVTAPQQVVLVVMAAMVLQVVMVRTGLMLVL